MIPTEVSGSRFPVGSSQTSSGGWLTNGARDRDALLLAAGELVGQRVHLVREPDHVHDLGHLAADRRRRLALHLERVGDVLGGGAVRQQLEVLEDAADVAAQHAARSSARRRVRSRPPTKIRPRVGSSSLSRSRMIVDLPEPDGADDEDELALVDHEGDVAERGDVGLVDLRHRLEHDHRRRGPATVRPRSGCSSRSGAVGNLPLSEGLRPHTGLSRGGAGYRARTGLGSGKSS